MRHFQCSAQVFRRMQRMSRASRACCHGSQPGGVCVIVLLLSLLLTLSMLIVSNDAVLAKGARQVIFQGLILQVDRTNSNDVTFSVLDQRNPITFHLTANTQFFTKQSASQLSVNHFVVVKANAVGRHNATQVHFEQLNKGYLPLQGVVASVNQSRKSSTIALNDGTILTVTNISHAQKGSTISLKVHFTATGSLDALTYRVIELHAHHFEARGIISHIDARTHRLTLVSPSGASISIVRDRMNALHVGEKVDVSGSTDSQGNLSGQSIAVESSNEQQIILEGSVSSIDANANTFSLVDGDGNVSTLKADPSILASIHVGGIYQIEVIVGTDGGLTAVNINFSEGDDQGEMLILDGLVQTFDASSGALSLTAQNGESFTLIVNGETSINSDSGGSTTLASGQAISASVQPNSDGSYTALQIDIQDNGSSDGTTFSGTLQSYDPTSGQLTINTTDNQTVSFTIISETVVTGATSVDSITFGTFLQVVSRVQPDGSYVARKVEAQNNTDSDHSI